MDLNEIMTNLDNLIGVKEHLKKYLENQPVTFYRHETGIWKGKKNWTTWKILLDTSISQVCVRDRQGFKHFPKAIHYQTVIAPGGTKDILLSKNKEDWPIADEILNNLAKEKYDR